MNARFFAAVSIVTAIGCSSAEKSSTDTTAAAVASTSSVDLNGAGATFPYPLYLKWFSDYATKTGVKINYQSVGSGAGVNQIKENTVDFGASDGPMSDEELAAAKGGPILHFPTVLGAVVLTYNLPEVTTPLKLTGPLIADIFLGKVTKWNDSRIAAENAGVRLPNKDILVVHRSDGSGTTYVFTDYLTKTSKEWEAGPGRGKAVSWKVGLGGRGNEGVSGTVKQTPGTIGYVELVYAKQNNLPAALVKNSAGQLVEPTPATITAAAEGAMSQLGADSDYRVSITNSPAPTAYPISSFTWLLVYEKQADATKGKKLVDFMRWMYGEGQQAATALNYAPLPAALAAQLTERLSKVQGAGQ